MRFFKKKKQDVEQEEKPEKSKYNNTCTVGFDNGKQTMVVENVARVPVINGVLQLKDDDGKIMGMFKDWNYLTLEHPELEPEDEEEIESELEEDLTHEETK